MYNAIYCSNIIYMNYSMCMIETDLFFELIEGGRTFWHTLLGVGLDFLRCEDMIIQQELSHELIPVVHPQVSVCVK